MIDGITPTSSADIENVPRFTWWPHEGTREWAQLTFAKVQDVSQCRVYWFDDQAVRGNCRTPESWKLYYRHHGHWVPVSNPSGYGDAINQYNVVRFTPVATGALRMVVQLKPHYSGGIMQWKVN